ncbi:hypothetical protein PG999_002506 [Apiospora kogelbergensis]|uniref:Uncharacterized protein n=1 Tax=Apiospora kogelbergensis TaxID=1337665 RepID=A0AAW0R8L8_9PEZI
MGRPEEAGAVGSEEAPPPPYTEGKGNEAASSSRPTSAVSARTMPPPPPPATTPYRQFPAAFNLYHQKSKSGRSLVYTLGEHDSDPIYTLTIHSGVSGNPSLVLHNGPDPAAPALASADKEPGEETFANKITGKASIITLPALPNFGRPTTEEPLETHVTISGAGYAFSLEWTRERFEWRHSRGSEVKALDKLNSGWKLVRIHSEADGVGGNRRARDQGASSDGKELVAVFAEVSGWSTSKVVKFKFLGSGATGEMGTRWSVMAVMTALRIWDMQNGLSESAAATAAGHQQHARSSSKSSAAAAPTTGAPGGAATGGSEKFT